MPTFAELQNPIHTVVEFYNGKLPTQHALAWEGYICALAEWQLLSVTDHQLLSKLLSQTPAAPGVMITLGPQGAKETMDREGIADLATVSHA